MKRTIEGTLKHALFLARHLNKCDPDCIVVVVLLELGIPTKNDGFEFLKNSVMLLYEDPSRPITKEIYPNVGMDSGRFQVEQSIRRTITEAWKVRDEKTWGYYFPQDENGNVMKPTNAEFISAIVRFLELWEGCRKEVAYERT